MSSPWTVPLPVPLAAAAGVARDMERLAATPLWCLTDRQSVDMLQQLDQIRRRVESVTLAVLADVDHRGAATEVGQPSTQALLRNLLRGSPKAAKGELCLAQGISDRYHAVRDALASGAMNPEQARVIVRGLDALPSRIDPARVAEAEMLLVDQAQRLDAIGLGKAVKAVRYYLDPDGEDDLARDEDADRDRSWFTVTDDYGGGGLLAGWVDDQTKHLIRQVLSALTRPKRRPDGSLDTREPRQRRGEALREVFRRAANLGDLPTEGGQRPHVSVTIRLETLQQRIDQIGAWLDDGTPISSATARRLACDAEILPVVLGSNSEPLDVGRLSRLVTTAMRRVLIVRDGGCVQPGCGKPAAWADAHHLVHWADGGATAVHNLALGCEADHQMWHRDGWQLRIGADRHIELLAPPHIDPTQTWQPGWRRRPDGTHGPPDP